MRDLHSCRSRTALTSYPDFLRAAVLANLRYLGPKENPLSGAPHASLAALMFTADRNATVRGAGPARDHQSAVNKKVPSTGETVG